MYSPLIATTLVLKVAFHEAILLFVIVKLKISDISDISDNIETFFLRKINQWQILLMQIIVLVCLYHWPGLVNVIPLTWPGLLYHWPGFGWLYHRPGQVCYPTDLAWLVDPLFSGLDKTDLTNSWTSWLSCCNSIWACWLLLWQEKHWNIKTIFGRIFFLSMN